MEGMLGRKGRLEAVFARGWLGAQEAAALGVGGVVLGDTAAGTGAELTYEGRWLGRGEIYIVGGASASPLLGLRLASLEREAREAPEPIRGEGLVDLLPFELVVGSAEYCLGDLGEASLGSIISLDTMALEAQPIVLRIAGQEAGRGRPVVLGERLGILLDEVPAGAPSPSFAAGLFASGSWLPPEEVPSITEIKVYDFSKPDRFTARSLHALEGLHRRVAEEVSRSLPGQETLGVSVVDQMTWGEWLQGRRGEGRLLTTAFGRPGRPYERGLWPERKGMALIQPAEARFPLPPGLSEEVARWTAEEEGRFSSRILVLDLQGSLRDLPLPRLLFALGGAWRLVTDAVFGQVAALGDEGTSEAGGSSLHRDMMVALVALEAPEGRLDLVYSAAALYPLTAALERYERYSFPR